MSHLRDISTRYTTARTISRRLLGINIVCIRQGRGRRRYIIYVSERIDRELRQQTAFDYLSVPCMVQQ